MSAIVHERIEDELADKARADGLHDFGRLGPTSRFNDGRNEAFAPSVTGRSAYEFDEDTVMDVTFGTGDVRDGTWRSLKSQGQSARAIWESLPDGGTSSQQYFVFSQQGDQTARPYRIKRVVFMGPTGGVKKGAQLASELDLDGAVLQVDFNHHGFLSRLKEGETTFAGRPRAKIGYLHTAATLNDPASKTPPTDRIFQPDSAGVELTAYVQTSGTTVFPGGKPFDRTSPLNNFVSQYDVELSGIQTKTMFGSRGRAKQAVDIKFTSGRETTVISDSKGQNSPAQLQSFIVRLLAKLGIPRARFDLSTKWQQKRSGDWLQVLHARLLKTMTFNPPLPPTALPYFVSHDRIAIAYALEMGMNCLFFTDDSVIEFRNDEQSPAMLAAQSRACQDALAAIPEGRKAQLQQFANDLRTAQQASLASFADATMLAINQLGAAIPANQVNLASLEASIRTILTGFMKYTHVEQLYPTLAGLVSDARSADPCVSHSGYTSLQALYDQHEGNAVIPRMFHTQFERSMLYKTAAEWTIEPSGFVNRLRGFVGVPADGRDRYLFLPFLQSSKNVPAKEGVVRVFQTLQGLLGNDDLLTLWGAQTASRKARVRMGLNNLFGQVYIFLKTIPVETPTDAAAASVSFFTNTVGDQAEAPPEPVGPDGRPQLGFVNQTTLQAIATTKDTLQSEPDVPLEEDRQQGGWRDGSRPTTTIGIDHDQCTDPVLYAYVDYASVLFLLLQSPTLSQSDRSRITDIVQRVPSPAILTGIGARETALQDDRSATERGWGFGGGRRPLYGGVVMTQTMTQEPPLETRELPLAADVKYSLLLLGSKEAEYNTYKLAGAPDHLVADYWRAIQFLVGASQLPNTSKNALALWDFFSHATFLNDEDVAAVFSIDLLAARTFRLFFSALQQYQPMTRPENAGVYFREAAASLAPLYRATAEPTSVSALQTQLQTLKKTILDRYGVTVKVFPGQGQVLAPGVKNPQTPEELRAARLRTFRAGSRKPLYRRTYRRPRTSTTP